MRTSWLDWRSWGLGAQSCSILFSHWPRVSALEKAHIACVGGDICSLKRLERPSSLWAYMLCCFLWALPALGFMATKPVYRGSKQGKAENVKSEEWHWDRGLTTASVKPRETLARVLLLLVDILVWWTYWWPFLRWKRGNYLHKGKQG